MKKKLLIALSLLAAAFVFAAQGCKQDEPEPENPGNTGGGGEYTITISDPALELDVLDRVDISATVKKPDGSVADSGVTWVSSDASVVKVSNGTLDALKSGTATVTASAEGKSAECLVTVVSPPVVRPQIIVTPTEMTLKKDQSTSVSPYVKFKSRTLDDSEYSITYSFESSAADIVSVTGEGVITALKETGDAEITVKANLPLAASAGIDQNLTQTIKVSVKPDYKFSLALKEGDVADIYLKEVDEYKESAQVVVGDHTLNGAAFTGWTFKSSDTTVATVSADGVVTPAATAVENDKAKIYAEYEQGGAVLKTNEIEFTVRKATVDKPLDSELMLDLSVEGLTLNAAELFGEDFTVTDIKDSEKPAASLWKDGCINKDAVTGLGERKLVVESKNINYRVNAWVVTKVITTAGEICDLFSPASGNAIPVVDGYYVLGQDIEAGNAAFKYRGWGTADGTGLVGTFDGRGHTVDGLKINTAGGIFGVVSKTGVVKNVAFTNVEVSSTGHAVALAYFVHGTIENVFVSVNKLATTSTSAGNTAGLISQTAGAATIKNLVAVFNPAIEAQAGDWGVLEAKSNVGSWENVFVVAGDRLFGGATTAGDDMSQYGKSIAKFGTVEDLLASEYYGEKKAEYAADIWDLEKMTFKSSERFIKAELEGLEASLELAPNEPTAIVDNSRIYTITSDSDKLKIENGKVTALQNITSADNVTVTVSWGGVEKTIAITASATLDCKFSLALKEGDSTDLYLKGAGEFKESAQVVVSEHTLNGAAFTGWTFRSSDATVATVSADGVVTLAATAAENDKAKIYAEYEYGGEIFKSNEIEFTVRKVAVDKPLENELMLDLSVDGLTLNALELFGEGFEITGVKDSENLDVNLWKDGLIDKDAVTELGERKLIVESDKINYRVDAWVVTKVITTANEICELFSPASGSAIPVVDGYYVLGQDIEAGNAAFKYRAWGTTDGTGLVGTFDGRGHTVDGLKINTSGGIFGVISKNAVVKNVAFTNVEVDSTGHAVVLAYFVHGTIENVFVGVNKLATTSASSGNTAGLISQTAGAATIKNLVAVFNPAIEAPAGDWGVLEAKSNVGAWENVFVIAGDRLFGGATTAGDTMSKYGKSVAKFETLQSLRESEYYNEKKAEYPEAIWDLKTMTFKSSESYFKAELSGLGAVEVKVNEPTAIAKNFRLFYYAYESDKLRIENGKVTALQKIVLDDVVRVTVSWGNEGKAVQITTTVEISAITINLETPLLANSNAAIEIENEVFNGAVSAVKIDDTEVSSGVSASNGRLIFAQGTIEALMGVNKLKSGEHVITLNVDDCEVTVNAVIAWTINTKAELDAMTNYLSFGTGNYNNNASAKTSNGYLVLGTDINFANSVVAGGWNGSCVKDYFFEGTFDGRGYGISNISIGNDSNKNTQMGLFGNIGANGTIKNLRLMNVNLTGTCAAIAYLSYGSIENVYVKGTVKADSGSYGQYTATSLLVGRYMSNTTSKVSNVIVEAVTALDSTTLKNSSVFGKLGAGGVGEANVFTNCFAINANDVTLFAYSATSNPKNFDEANGNGNFADIAAAWANETAAGILSGLGVENTTT